MAIKINVPIHTKSGLTISTGVIVTFDVTFPALQLTGMCSFNSYTSLTDLQEGKPSLRDRMDEYSNNLDVLFTKEELTGPNNPLPLLEAKIMEYIELGTGAGTCEIVDLLAN